MYKTRIIDGVQCSPQGVPLEMGIRCPHGVVDGNKPLSVVGPRCLTCREDWYPRQFLLHNDGTEWVQQHCKTCGDMLHIIYLPSDVTEIDMMTGQKVTVQRHFPSFYAHRGGNGYRCALSTYPIRGEEERYSLFGAEAWAAYSEMLVKHDLEQQQKMERELSEAAA